MVKKSAILLLFFSISFGKSSFAEMKVKEERINFAVLEVDSLEKDTLIVPNEERKVKFRRGKAILFTIFTGILGGHRVYLGTHQRTPILYSVTLGGLGILPLIDLAHIIFTKDLSKFNNVPQIIMWRK